MKRSTRAVRAGFLAALLIVSLVTNTLPFHALAEEPPVESIGTEIVSAEETETPAPADQDPEPVEPPAADAAPEQMMFTTSSVEDAVEITLEVYTASETLYAGTVAVEPCAPRETDAATANVYCALHAAGVDTTWSWWRDAAFLNTIEGIGNGSGSENYWMWFTEREPGYTGLNEHILEDGESIIVTIDRMPTRLSIASTSPALGESVEASVEGFDAIAFAYEPLEGASLSGVTTAATNASGTTTFSVSTTDEVRVHAYKDGYLDSNEVTIEAYEPEVLETEITLEVYTATTTLFKGALSVSACAPRDGDAAKITGYCALEEAGIPTTWSWWGDSAFLDTAGGIGNGAGSDTYWLWFSDSAPGYVGLNEHELTAGEELVITIDRTPIKLSVASSSPTVGEPTPVTVEGFDAMAFAYEPLEGATLAGVSANATDTAGRTYITATTTNPFSIYATREGFLDSDEVTLSPAASSTGTTGTGGGTGDTEESAFDIDAAFLYLASVEEDGFVVNEVITDWSAIAFAVSDAPRGTRSKIATYLKEESFEFRNTSDYIRHAMAMLALGLNPYTDGPDDVITHIVDSFDGVQIGEAAYMNDDIFALFPLLRAGYTKNDELIKDIVDFVLSQQSSDGSWMGGVDLTSAAVQALKPVSSLPGVSSALEDAEAYLRSKQKDDGGFGEVFATTWAIQAIESLGDSPESWTKGGETPVTYLASLQQSDGGLVTPANTTANRAWATAYAIPAAAGATWYDLMDSVSRPSAPVPATSSGEDDTAATTTAPVVEEAVPVVPETAPEPLTESFVFEAAAPLAVRAAAEPVTESEVSETPIEDVPQSSELAASAAGAEGASWLMGMLASLWRGLVSFFEGLFS